MNYKEKLQRPAWQKKRLEIMQRDGFSCQHCGDKETTLHVHHKTYTRNTEPWDYPESNFITLCEPCHSVVELLKEMACDIFRITKNKIQKQNSISITVYFLDSKYFKAGILFLSYDLDSKALTVFQLLNEKLLNDIVETFEMAKQKAGK